MSKEAVAVVEQSGAVALPDSYLARLNAIRNVICKDATDEELRFFAGVCQAKKMDPFGQQIYLVKRRGKDGPSLAIQTGVDGFRAQAARSGEYAGNDEPVFHYADGAKFPVRASVTVWRMIQGQRVAFTASARWEEFYPGDVMGFMWKSKPHVMLGKCAECQALRKAFPNECGGLYESAELDRVEEARPAIQIAADLNAKFAAKQVAATALAPYADVTACFKAFNELGIEETKLREHLKKPSGDLTVQDLDAARAWYAEVTAEAPQ